MSVHVFGIRHHGPGCARSLDAALGALEPDAVLVEGPPDADPVLPLAAHLEMRPPVALLVYRPDAPRRAAYYPFAAYSPEWRAIRYALARNVPVRFMDLPMAYRLAEDDEPEPPVEASDREDGRAAPDGADAEDDRGGVETSAPPDLPRDGGRPDPDGGRGDPEGEHEDPSLRAEGGAPGASPGPAAPPSLEDDPIGHLARAAGYDDGELWWEHQVERRADPAGLWDAILEAMGALRALAPEPDEREARREAWMRRAIREAEREGRERIAVVCGAWHAPVLTGTRARGDAALLRGLPKVKVEATWAPWTNGRLAYRSGYGAGVLSPGWYEQLWEDPERLTTRWVALAARLLRAEGLDAPPASLIEAVRLAETLAALRGVPVAGLAELHEAIRTVLCAGDSAPMALVRDRLEIGDRLGEIPAEAPAAPLARDLAREQRRLRLRPSPDPQDLDLDLRTDTGLARSRLLHRLALLGVPWGRPERASGATGTFREAWTVRWDPVLQVQLIEAGAWGNTVEAASEARARDLADDATDLPALTGLLDAVTLAGLGGAFDRVLSRLRDRAAVGADVPHLLLALPPLARVARYGDVRGAGAAQTGPVIEALFERAVIGLGGACRSLDDEAAAAMADAIGAAHEAVALLDRDPMREEWLGALRGLAEGEEATALLRGWAARLLLESAALDSEELRRLAGLALGGAAPVAAGASWVEGVLRGGGLALLGQVGLWRALDGWLAALPEEAFPQLLPVLRRAFAGFAPAERRRMGERVRRLGASPAEDAGDRAERIDRERAARVLPVLARILGVSDAATG